MKGLLTRIKRRIFRPQFNSGVYWENRYKAGGNSGSGSYGDLAKFKAKIINDFVEKNGVSSVIEFGCGDGNQLKLGVYPNYIGFDVSKTIIRRCVSEFKTDRTKSFFLYDSHCFVDNAGIFKRELSMSLDVLFHLVEQAVYEKYLIDLFNASKRYVVIYSSNLDYPAQRPDSHEFHRVFTKDVARLVDGWELKEVIKNEYPSNDFGDESGSLADFYIYQKV